MNNTMLLSVVSTDIIVSARAAAQNIQQNAIQKGFKGDKEDAKAVLTYLSNSQMDVTSYADLHANSAVIGESVRLINRWGGDAAKVEIAKFAAFDYNA